MTTFVYKSTTITSTWLNQVDTAVFSAPIQALAGVTPAADRVPYFNSATGASLAPFTTFGRSIVALANAAAAIALLGLGTAALANTSAFDAAGMAAAAVVTSEAYTDAGLALKANLASPALSGVPTAPTAGIGTNTTQIATTAFVLANAPTVDLSAYLTSATAASTYQSQAAMSSYALLAGPTFSGVPAAPTAAPGTNTTQLATTAFVTAAVPSIAGLAPIASPTFTGTVSLPTTSQVGRVTITPNVTHDMAGGGGAGTVLSANYLITDTATFAVADGKQHNTISLWPTVDVNTTGIYIGLNWQAAVTSSGVNAEANGIVASGTISGSGILKSIYGRATASAGFTGVLVAGVFGITPNATTGTSYMTQMSCDGPNGGFGIIMHSANNSDLGWGMYVNNTVEIRNSVWGFSKFAGTPGYNPNLITMYESNNSTMVFNVDAWSRVSLTPIAHSYDLVTANVAASLYVAPAALTIATGKQWEAVSIRPGNLTLSGTAAAFFNNMSAAVVASDAGTVACGSQVYITNAGAGISYGNLISIIGATGHTGAITVQQLSATMVTGSSTTIICDLSTSGGAGSFTAYSLLRLRGVAAGDKATYGIRIENTFVPVTSAISYDMKSGNTADFLTLYDEATSLNTFRITSAGSAVFGASCRISGDLGNATNALRLLFQSTTVNGNSIVGVIPNGSATTSGFRSYNNSDPSAALNMFTVSQAGTVSVIDASVLNAGTQGTMALRIGGSQALGITALKSVYLSGAALATNATDGFLYLPTCAGTPTGAPSAITGGLPVIVDSTNKIPYFFDGAAWTGLSSAVPPVAGPPPPPAAGAVLTVDTLMGNRLTYTGPDGEQIALEPSLGSRHIAAAIGIGNNSSSATYVGGALTSATGTNGNPGVQANTFLSSVHWLSKYTSTAAVNNLASARSNASCALGSVAGAGGFYFKITMYIHTITSTGRVYLGLYDSAGGLTGSIEASAHLNNIWLAADTGDANLQMMSNDGAGTGTKVDLGANFPKQSGEIYKLELYAAPNSSTVYYRATRIGTSYVATGNITATLPVAGTAISPTQGLSTGPSSSASVIIHAGEWYLETPY